VSPMIEINNVRQANQLIDALDIKYSICTLVNKENQYREMIDSFKDKGFNNEDIEYLYLDNSECNKYDAYAGYNIFLRAARGKYIVLCHQDILLLEDGRPQLDRLIAEIDRLDPNWGLLGNAGGERPGQLAIRISDPRGGNIARGQFPARVCSLDENFIVVKASANLGLSRDFFGYHFYGADLSMIGDILGYTSYVIDFHLYHKSSGNCDASFYAAREQFIRKYCRAFRSRYVITTNSTFFLSGNKIMKYLFNSGKMTMIASMIGQKFPRFFQ
jgi:hypothetical protein